MEMEEAFAALTKAAAAELEKVQQAGAAHFAKGDTVKVRQAADRVEKIKGWIAALERIQKEWDIPAPEEKPQQLKISVNTQKYEYRRTPNGTRTNQDDFWIPILSVLVEMGGRGRAQKILEKVGELMENVLNDIDRQMLPAGGSVRWRNTAQWAKLDMVHSRYLSDKSLRGTWEITEAGRKYLENRK
jgi:restriction system protein